MPAGQPESIPYGLFRYLYNHYEVRYAVFCSLAGRLGEDVKNEAVARVQAEWPDFGG